MSLALCPSNAGFRTIPKAASIRSGIGARSGNPRSPLEHCSIEDLSWRSAEGLHSSSPPFCAVLLTLLRPRRCRAPSPRMSACRPSGSPTSARRSTPRSRAARCRARCVAVARKGKLVFFEAFGYRDKDAGAPMTTDAIFNIASMTKPMTSVAALQLYEQGRLLMDDPLAKYFPKFGDTQGRRDGCRQGKHRRPGAGRAQDHDPGSVPAYLRPDLWRPRRDAGAQAVSRWQRRRLRRHDRAGVPRPLELAAAAVPARAPSGTTASGSTCSASWSSR